MLYDNLNTSDKALITKLLNTKQALNNTQELLNNTLAKAFNLVKDNGTITKGKSKIVYISQGEPKPVLDVDKLKENYPDIYRECLTTKQGSKEHLAIYLR